MTYRSSCFILGAFISFSFFHFPLSLSSSLLCISPLRQKKRSETLNTAAMQMFSFLFVLKIGPFLSLFFCLSPLWVRGRRRRQDRLLWSLAPGSQLCRCVCGAHTHAAHVRPRAFPCTQQRSVELVYQQQQRGDISIWTVNCRSRTSSPCSPPTCGLSDVHFFNCSSSLQYRTVACSLMTAGRAHVEGGSDCLDVD